jgi:hypothetical protein
MMPDKLRQYFWTHPHFKQFLVIGLIALSGLGAGSVVAARAIKKRVDPLPSPAATKQAKVALLGKTVTVPIASPSPTPTATAKAVVAPKTNSRGFYWGASILVFPFPEKNTEFLPEQFRLAQELGLSTVRVDYTVGNDALNRQVIDLASKYKMQLVFIIPFGPNDIFSDSKLSDNAYNYVKDIVSKYKGQVPVWQLATEVASVAIVDGGHYGVDKVDYPEAKYQAVSTWLKSATKAVKDADPSARRMINDQWVHVGFFERFIKDGGDFDILGWNWFSDMGTDWNDPVINAKTGQRYKLMDKLKSFKRDIWITEVNRRLGSSGGNEKAQADYIQTMADKAYAEPAIKALLVFNLVEDQKAPEAERGYGLVNVNQQTWWVGGLKQAFGRYQSIIKGKK